MTRFAARSLLPLIAGLIASLNFAGAAMAQRGAAMMDPTDSATTDTATVQPMITSGLTYDLQKSFDAASLGKGARLSILAVEADRGVVRVEINADTPMKPASLAKLLTCAAALEVLGPDQTFTTTVETNGIVKGATVLGDLVLRGGGDPTLGPRFQTDKSNNTEIFESWAAELRKKGIKSIQGNVIGNDLRYMDEPLAIGWEPTEYAEWYSAEVSPLCFNENVLDVLWRASSKPGDRVIPQVIPKTSFATVESNVRVGSAKSTTRLRYFRFKTENNLRARGTMPPNAQSYDFAAIHEPARFAAHVFMETLEAKGIDVRGTAMSQRILSEDEPTTEPLVLITHQSPSLAEMLPVILGNSQNLYAEVMLRETALASGLPASFRGGAQAVEKWLRSHRLHRSGFVLVDGSGLSPVDRIPARMIADVLRFEAKSPNAALWKSSLATPGKRSLGERFTGSQYAALNSDLQAKTGYIAGAHTLAGYLTNSRGTDYVFVIMINGYDPDRSREARDTLDDLVLELHNSELIP
ncbi:D-alanyl-D-alanine carboxypeptidase/D-alanyl-D-alanine-endopeptidase [soil metagenome]